MDIRTATTQISQKSVADSNWRSPRAHTASEDVYADIQGLQNLKGEKDEDVALKKIAKQFESLFMHEMLKTMRKSNEVFEQDSLFNSSDTQFFRDMYDQQLSVTLSQKGTGLADTIYQQLRRQYVDVNGAQASDKTTFEVPERSGERAMVYAQGRESKTQNSVPPQNTVQGILDSSPTAVDKHSAMDVAGEKSTLVDSAQQFVRSIFPHARAAANALGLSPLVLTAQAALETGWGKYVIQDSSGNSTHNFFNIKADRAWQGDKAAVQTVEFRNGVPLKERAEFRKYSDVTEGFQDYVNFLRTNPRYQTALASQDDVTFVQELQRAGYATDPQYAEKVVSIMRRLEPNLNL